ncbi:hypothetical protein [Dyadobacter arcticus]|uniref:Uncharacterized protein n=1 Tax=Dyadobacter arcticus TaxID=1078754 RepID=A0ABX0UHU3_9BACT|nr:hypothetical protein [Dyadobacter arcticus]NIJ52342.1 hypothetical protein [Dyadobacter arcticus]
MQPKFDLDYKNAKISLVGILGTVIGCLSIFYPMLCNQGGSVFHEISYDPRKLADEVVSARIKIFQDKYRKIEVGEMGTSVRTGADLAKKAPDGVKKRSALTPEELAGKARDVAMGLDKSNGTKGSPPSQDTSKTTLKDSLYKMYNLYQIYQSRYIYSSQADTAAFDKLNRNLFFNITSDSVETWSENYPGRKTFSFSYFIKDASLPVDSTNAKGEFAIDTSNNHNINFIARHPAVGVWIFCIVVFYGFCFITIGTSYDLKTKIYELFEKESVSQLEKYRYYLYATLSLVIILCLSQIWEHTFIDSDIIKNIFFMDTLRTSMNLTIILGYITGSLCIAGFLLTSGLLASFATQFKTNFVQADSELQKLQNGKKMLAFAKGYDPETKVVFLKVLEIFNTYFILISIVLSLMVLCTGTLFSAVNSLDFVKLIANDWGYSPARSEFVYLYGALHTTIVLIVYLPAKLRFDELEGLFNQVAAGEETAETTPKSKWSSLLNFQMESLKNLLVVVSPFLASLLNNLFTMLVQ